MSENHFDRLLRLLDLEAAAEAEQLRARVQRMSAKAAERTGNALVEMAVEDETAGLGGRWLMTFCKRNRTMRLPWTRLGIGSPVLVQSEDQGSQLSLRGVVSDRSDRTLQVAIAAPPETDEEPQGWRIDFSSDETARRRQRDVLKLARNADRGRITHWRKLLLGEREPVFHTTPPLSGDDGLNPSQRAAVHNGLAAEHWAIIHGPPGTGKTTTLVELIRRAVARGDQVLACAPSNMGVDNLVEKLVARGVRVVRLGHPARVMQSLREHTLDYLVDRHPDLKVAQKLLRDAEKLYRKAAKFTRAKPGRGERGAIRAEARQLSGEARRLERQVEAYLIDEAEVVCATLTGIDDDLLGEREFELAVIDEAAQATEPQCWIPLPRSKRLVLAGDHRQLPPTILSNEASAGGLGESLMERLMRRSAAPSSPASPGAKGAGKGGAKGPGKTGNAAASPAADTAAESAGEPARMLTVQYRMHRTIMEFSSRQFYDGRLQAADEVAEHRLVDLPGVAATLQTGAAGGGAAGGGAAGGGAAGGGAAEGGPFGGPAVDSPLLAAPLEFIDTAGAGYDESQEPDGESRLNELEAQLVVRKVRQLLRAGLAPPEIAVIAPYAAQVRRVRELLAAEGPAEGLAEDGASGTAVDTTGVEVDSVDGFQGREKEAVVVSLVRSNGEGEIGFLSDVRRMNVALTRARRKLLVVGDSATLAVHPFYKALLDYVEQAGAYRSVWEETEM